jgi:deoxyribodipyrimidine photo-lyase
MNVVWFKRDLRTADHAPLALAAGQGGVLALFAIEPTWLTSRDFSARHYRWVRASLIELRESLAQRGVTLAVRVGEVVELLGRLHAARAITGLWSHEETGNALTYARDRAVAAWCKQQGVTWTQAPQTGVVRRLRTRQGWAKRWEAFMAESAVVAPDSIEGVRNVKPGEIPTESDLNLPADPCTIEQSPGETQGLETLESFLFQRGQRYGASISSPLTAHTGGSRLSPYLAWGNLSMRTVVQHTRQRIASLDDAPDSKHWRRSLRMFDARLHWHCHFIQKLEDEPRIESANFVRAFDTLRPDAADPARFSAWCNGQTGYPLVDAVMRCLAATGWINFRMRAMIVSFSAYHLWQHWREPAIHLAKCFIDYEPGIHYSQMQMQSGTTGINTIRIYSPTKQALDQDPQGEFIRKWVNELSRVPTVYVHEPWTMPVSVQREVGCVIGKDYPAPIVDHSKAVADAKQQISAFRAMPITKAQADAVQDKHGSRKSGMRQVKRYRGRRAVDAGPGLFD